MSVQCSEAMSDYEPKPANSTPPILIDEGVPPQHRELPAQQPPPHPDSKFQAWLRKLGPVGASLAILLTKIKTLASFGYLALKAAKFTKVFLTIITMFVSIWVYSKFFGVQFAVGFVVLILIHELGHVFVAWRQGLSITAPVFVPFMGAVIFNKRSSNSAWAQAIMGIGGPVGGSLGCLGSLGIFSATGNPLFLALANVGFFMNLFNLMPIVPLDGGWIVGAISPWLWLVGLVGLLAMTILGYMHNPFVWIIVILTLPRVWSLFRPGPGVLPGILVPPTMGQRMIMGVYYFALASALMYAYRVTDDQLIKIIGQRS